MAIKDGITIFLQYTFTFFVEKIWRFEILSLSLQPQKRTTTHHTHIWRDARVVEEARLESV